jgi:hypothetical protein
MTWNHAKLKPPRKCGVVFEIQFKLFFFVSGELLFGRDGLFIVRVHLVHTSNLRPPILIVCKFGFCNLFVATLDFDLELATFAPRPQI